MHQRVRTSTKVLLGGVAIAVLVLVGVVSFAVNRVEKAKVTTAQGCRAGKNITSMPNGMTPTEVVARSDRDATDQAAVHELFAPADSFPSDLRPAADMYYGYVRQITGQTSGPITKDQAAAAAEKVGAYLQTCST